jgi:hypothetical protein
VTTAEVIAKLRRQPIEFEGLHLMPWSAAERADFAAWRAANPGPIGLMEQLFSRSVCDETGLKLFANPEMVSDLDGVFVERVSQKVVELNGLGVSDPKGHSTGAPN